MTARANPDPETAGALHVRITRRGDHHARPCCTHHEEVGEAGDPTEESREEVGGTGGAFAVAACGEGVLPVDELTPMNADTLRGGRSCDGS